MKPDTDAKKPSKPVITPPRKPTQSQVDQDRAEGEGMGLGSLQPTAEPVPSDEQPRHRENQ